METRADEVTDVYGPEGDEFKKRVLSGYGSLAILNALYQNLPPAELRAALLGALSRLPEISLVAEDGELATIERSGKSSERYRARRPPRQHPDVPDVHRGCRTGAYSVMCSEIGEQRDERLECAGPMRLRLLLLIRQLGRRALGSFGLTCGDEDRVVAEAVLA